MHWRFLKRLETTHRLEVIRDCHVDSPTGGKPPCYNPTKQELRFGATVVRRAC